MKVFNILTISIYFIIGACHVSYAQDFDKGLEAAQSGNFKVAIKEWTPLAENGNSQAQEMLGIVFQQGLGGAKNYEEAFMWTNLAAQQGSPTAQNRLGDYFLKGLGITENRNQAMEWFKLASEQGHLEALTNQGIIYMLTEDFEKAIVVYKRAASRGEPRAQYSLGLMYEKGIGFAPNNILAFMWYDLSSSNQYEFSITSRDNLLKIMSNEEIEKARAIARNCLMSSYKNCD
tara:strand:- start:397 stop:1092 length:696 start_codon:yes stop_codon:yes gene_type:complete